MISRMGLIELLLIGIVCLGPLLIAAAVGLVYLLNRPKARCPYCAERIQPEAKVCPHCGRDLTPQDEPFAED